MRARKRRFCSFLETLSQNLRMTVPFRARCSSCREDFLVVAPVEDAEAAAFREALRGAPQEVVVQILHGGSLEGENLTACGVHPGHDGLNRPVLPSGVHGLEDEEDAEAVIRVQQALQFVQLFGQDSELPAALLLSRGAVGRCGGETGYRDIAIEGDEVGADEGFVHVDP